MLDTRLVVIPDDEGEPVRPLGRLDEVLLALAV